jgi:lipoprotein-releasing system ATP-binding protein
MASKTEMVLEMKGIKRTFHQGGRALKILRGTGLSVAAGEVVGLLGPSGSGKSTLLHIAGLLEMPDAGSVSINGEKCGDLTERKRTVIRRHGIGFVYQFHHLLPEFTALENVLLPQLIAERNEGEAREHAEDILARLGLKSRLEHLPAELSGGEQQRVAIARALANDPALLLADEPTGNLDESTAAKVMDELIAAARKKGVGALIATHNMTLASRMDRCVHLHDGKLQEHAE